MSNLLLYMIPVSLNFEIFQAFLTSLPISRVASLSERNQMNPHNLSIIFGPSLLGAPPEKANLFQDLPVQNAAIELMITHFHQVFDRTFKYQNQPMLEWCILSWFLDDLTLY